MHPLSFASLLALTFAIPAEARAQEITEAPVATRTARFTSLNRTFLIDLPEGFRQLAPVEATRLEQNPEAPHDWRFTSPRSLYAIGPVDRWLAGDFATPWLLVREEKGEWHVETEFASQLASRWHAVGEEQGVQHEVSDVREVEIGPQGHRVWRATRRSTLADGRRIRSIDIYAPTGGRQVTLTLRAWDANFEQLLPEFEDWLSTLTFSRRSRGEQSLSDRLWVPALTGALVGLALLALYKHTRRSR